MKKLLVGNLWALILAACDVVETQSVDEHKQQYDNGYQISLEKHSIDSRTIGKITGTVYGSQHLFEYNFELDPGSIEWRGNRGAEPVGLTFCASDIFLHLREPVRNPAYVEPTIGQETAAQPSAPEPDQSSGTEAEPAEKYYIGHHYARFVDERFFFKLLGKAYWLDISQSEYQAQTTDCKTYPVPNSGEY